MRWYAADRASPDEEEATPPGGNPGPVERVERVEQAADHAFERGAGELRRLRVGPQTHQRAGGVGEVRRPLAVEVGDHDDPARARCDFQCGAVELGGRQAEQPRDGVGHLGGVEGADQREVAAGGVGESRHRAGGVGSRAVRHREDGAGGAEGDGHIALDEPESERGRHVVAGSGPDDDLAPRARRGRRSEHGRARPRDRARPVRGCRPSTRRWPVTSSPYRRRRPGR